MTRSQGEPCPPSLRQSVRAQQPIVLAVECPQCQAQAGQPCKAPSGRKLTNQHGSRYDAAGLPTRLVTGSELREAS